MTDYPARSDGAGQVNDIRCSDVATDVWLLFGFRDDIADDFSRLFKSRGDRSELPRIINNGTLRDSRFTDKTIRRRIKSRARVYN